VLEHRLTTNKGVYLFALQHGMIAAHSGEVGRLFRMIPATDSG
jgi:hypothetical protein